jgi:putative endonuclease
LKYKFDFSDCFENHKALGDFGENLACLYLESKGCEIIKQNYIFMRHEIDIIAKDGEYIVFIEVKTRTNWHNVTAAQNVDYKKQKRIIYAARGWLFENNTDLQPRFDVIEVYRDIYNDKNYIRRIESAFILTDENRTDENRD